MSNERVLTNGTMQASSRASLSLQEGQNGTTDENWRKNEREIMPPSDLADWTDYGVGALYIILGLVFAALLIWGYWNMHGGSVEKFLFWADGDKKWLEVLFWSFFTAHVWNMTDIGWYIGTREFQKCQVWYYISRTFEAPPTALALVSIVLNFGIAFGDTTISLKDAPILLIIALSIVSAYFSREAADTLKTIVGTSYISL